MLRQGYQCKNAYVPKCNPLSNPRFLCEDVNLFLHPPSHLIHRSLDLKKEFCMMMVEGAKPLGKLKKKN